MALSSTSTDAEVYAAYEDNANYRELESAEKAWRFVEACRILIFRMPKSAGGVGGGALQMNPEMLQDELHRAELFAESRSANRTTGSVRHVSFEGFRD